MSGFAATKQTKIYIFGVATSFNDSTLYITEIQEISGAYIDSKTKFLVERDNYSYQLRDYLKGLGEQTPTATHHICYRKEKRLRKILGYKKEISRSRIIPSKANQQRKFHIQAHYSHYNRIAFAT